MKLDFRDNTDLFTIEADAYAQGVNCFGEMGAGIALKFRLNYPEMYAEYQRLCYECGYDKETLAGSWQVWNKSDPQIINLFTQYYKGRHAKLEYITESFYGMLGYACLENLNSIAIPDMIGCGIGGLKRSDVLNIITTLGESSEWNGTLIVASL